MRISDTWQYKELKKYLAHSPGKTATVKLVHPGHRQELDSLIRNHLWPGVIEGLQGRNMVIGGSNKLEPQIIDSADPFCGRSFSFYLDDPARPPGGDRPWFCRCNVKVTVSDYLANFNFHLFLPERVRLANILRLLKDPDFVGAPPELSCEQSFEGTDIFCIKFTKGYGSGWAAETPQAAKDHLNERVQENLDIIEACYLLEQDFNDSDAFNKLAAVLTHAYASG